MKIGVISDIHSNIDALEAVFKFFKSNSINIIICLGDIIGIGPYPEKCVDFLMNCANIKLFCVQGNHENYLINGIKRHNHKDSAPMKEEELSVHYWNHLRLNEKEKNYIINLKKRGNDTIRK